MAKFRDITSIDPLNIALTATSKKFRVLWLTITLIALVALIVLTTIFTLKYLSEPKAVITSVKPNRQPFPAVTFCNMNPYKVSALAASPQLADLIYYYKDTQKITGNLNSGVNLDKKRQKREVQALSPTHPCCKSQRNTSAYDPTVSSSIFTRFEVGFLKSNWSCGFSCCNFNAPSGKKSRLARTDNQALIAFLLAKEVIAENPVYVGMRGSPPGSYWWYNDIDTPCNTVSIPDLCHNCTVVFHKRNWTEGGPVMISTRGKVSVTAFTNTFDTGNGVGYLCEFFDDIPVGSEPSLSCSAGLSSTAKHESTSVQLPHGQTSVPAGTAATIGESLFTYFPGVPDSVQQVTNGNRTMVTGSESVSVQVSTKTAASIGGSLYTDFPGVPTEAGQSEPSSSTGLLSAVTVNAESISVSREVPEGQTGVPAATAAVSGESLYTDLPGGPTEAHQSEPSSSTGLTSPVAVKVESISVSRQVPEGQTKNLTETVVTIGRPLITDFPEIPDKAEQYILAALQNASGSDLSRSATSEDMLPYLINSLSPNVGYALDDVVVGCVYDGHRCKKSDFELQIDPYYGNCYTYNAFGKKAISNRPGAVGGLSVIYFADQDEYLDFIASSGSRVIVHDQNSTVFPDVSGYSMPAGYANALAMRLTEEACISTQANPCASYPSDVPNFNYAGKAYSTEGCLRSCFQKYIIERCHCGDPRIPLPPNNTKVKHCHVTKRDCVTAFYDRDHMKDECNCPAACKRNIYEAITSKTRWTQLYDQHTDKNGTLFDRKKNQLAKIDIYFEDLSVIEYAEKIKYEMFELLLDFSSIAGLFLGMSVMSIFEIWHLILYIRKKCFQETSG